MRIPDYTGTDCLQNLHRSTLSPSQAPRRSLLLLYNSYGRTSVCVCVSNGCVPVETPILNSGGYEPLHSHHRWRIPQRTGSTGSPCHCRSPWWQPHFFPYNFLKQPKRWPVGIHLLFPKGKIQAHRPDGRKDPVRMPEPDNKSYSP